MSFNIPHQYNIDGNPNALLYPSGANVQYTYSARNQIAGVLFNNNALASYQYDLNGQRTLKTLANGGITNYDYDAARQLTMLKQNAPGLSANSEYIYDAVGNRTNQQRGDGTTEAYGYDATDQLTSANYDNQAIGLKDHQATYAYDPNGNRTNITDDGNAIAYVSNALNQYTTAAGDPLAYNANGSLTSQKSWTYTYDAQNRLVSAQKGATQMSFAYDALNRCIKRTLNGTPMYLCYAGWNLIEEHASNGNLNVTYVHGANTDEMLIKSDVNGTVYYHEDALGSVTHLSDEKGNLVEQYRYDAFGKPTFLDAQNNVLANSAYGNRFLFTGREWLQDIALYDYRNRIDSADLARFLQPDPLRFAAGDVNLYRYCRNNAINLKDPLGLEPVMPPTGVWWLPAPCSKGETRFIQIITWPDGTKSIDNGATPWTRGWLLGGAFRAEGPLYPQRNQPGPGFFGDDPSAWAKTSFEVCRACICEGKILSIGPCKKWKAGDNGDLSTFPGSDSPSADFEIIK